MSAQAAVEDVNNVLAELEAADATKATQSTDAVENEGAQGSADAQNTQRTEADANGSADTTEGRKDSGSRNGGSRNERDNRGGRGERGGRGGRGRGRGGFSRNYQDNVKSNVISEEKSSDPDAIRKQVEFYFSDANLPKDQFLLREVAGSENKPVPLDTIRSFKRMRHFEPTEAIVAALKESTVVRMVEDDTKVQRIEPLPKHFDDWVSGKVKTLDSIRIFEDKAMPRTVYVKGFGHEIPSSQFDIEAFFAPYGPTNAIRLRRADDKVFKGSVFVEFESEELARKFVELEPKPKYKERDLKIMMKKDYCEAKKEDIEAGRIKASRDRPFGKRGRGGNRQGDRRRDDDRDWRTRRDEDKKNGFKDRRGRDDRDNKPRSQGSRETEKDANGVPVVKEVDSDRAAALAQAKAAVEAESKKEDIESKKRERDEETADEPAAKKVDVKGEA